MTKRFDPVHYGAPIDEARMEESEFGKYVLASDYESLRSQLSAALTIRGDDMSDDISVRDEFTNMVNARIAMLREHIAIQDKNLEQRDQYITELRSQLSAAEQDARKWMQLFKAAFIYWKNEVRPQQVPDTLKLWQAAHNNIPAKMALDAALPVDTPKEPS